MNKNYWRCSCQIHYVINPMVIFCHYREQMKWRGGEGCTSLACVASVSVWFRSKERLHEERDSRFWSREKWNKSQKNESGGALLLTPFFAQSLTLVPRSLFLNRTETFATQASTSSTYNNVACIRVPASILYLGCVGCAGFSLLFSERFLSGCSSFSFSL